MGIPDTDFVSNNYSSDLRNIFPVVEYHYVKVTGDSSSVNGTINLINTFNTTHYAVFTSIYYGYGGSSGTYDAKNTSGAINPVVIYNITESSFEWVLAKNTGDNVNIFIVFMIVFNDKLDYPKKY